MKNGILGNRPLNLQFLQSTKLNENISLKFYPNGNLRILWYFLRWPITKEEVEFVLGKSIQEQNG